MCVLKETSNNSCNYSTDKFLMPPNHGNTKSHQKEFKPVPMELDEIGKKIVHAAYLVGKESNDSQNKFGGI